MKNTSCSKWLVFKGQNSKDSARFKIKPLNNPEYSLAMVNLTLFSRDLSIADFFNQFAEIVSHHLVTDWENISFKENGEVVEVNYSPENALKLFLMGFLGLEILSWVVTSAFSLNSEMGEGV